MKVAMDMRELVMESQMLVLAEMKALRAWTFFCST